MKKVTVTYVGIEDFFEFLTQNKCTLAFLRNFLASREGDDGNAVDRLVEAFKSDPKRIIASSFVWKTTSEDYDYWKNLDSKWKSLFKGSERVEALD